MFFHHLILLYRPFENQLNTLLSKHQIQRAQWSIMYYFSVSGPATLVELSHYMGVEKPTVTRTIQRLEELGYVEQVSSKDKRAKKMQLTSLGTEAFQKIRMTIDQFERDILKGISVEEQQEAIRIMREIRENLQKKGNM